MYAVGAFGAIIGTVAAGFLFIPHFASTFTLILVQLFASPLVFCVFVGSGAMHQLFVTLPGAAILFLTSLYVLDQPQVCDQESEYFVFV